MIFVTGPRYSGKHVVVRNMLQLSEEPMRVIDPSLEDVGNATDFDAYVKELCAYDVVILSEVGSGVIPMDAEAVNLREKCGELAQRLATQADVVVRVMCGIPQVLKGTMDL